MGNLIVRERGKPDAVFIDKKPQSEYAAKLGKELQEFASASEITRIELRPDGTEIKIGRAHV